MKTAEQKAFEEYPLPKEETESASFINQETFNSAKRTGYIVGYNQAMQDFLEKACYYLKSTLQEDDETNDFIVQQFKNYMQDES